MKPARWILLLGVAACGAKEPAKPPAAQEPSPAPKAEPVNETEMDATYLADLAQVHLNHRNQDMALALLQRALEKEDDPASRARLQMRVGETYDQLGRKEDAMRSYEEASKNVGDPAQKALLMLRLGQSYRRADDMERAASALEAALAQKAQPYVHDSARSEIIQVWHKQGVLKDRIADYESQLARNPKDTDLLRFLGMAYATALAQPDKAIPYYQKLVGADPNQFGIAWQLGNLYYQARQFEQGVAYFKGLAERMPDRRTEMYERVASGYASLGKKSEALTYAKKMGETATASTPHLFVQQAHLLGRIGQDNEAVASFKKAIEMARNDSQRQQFRYDLASFHSSRKHFSEGRELLEQLQSEEISDPLRKQISALLEDLERQATQSQGAAPSAPPAAPTAN